MWQYRNTNELYHFGIPGMHWGHRKAKQYKANQKVYRTKLSNISKNLEKTGNNKSDAKKIAYLNQKGYARVGKTIMASVASMLVSDLITGKIGSYGSMSKAEVIKKVGQLSKSAAVNVALSETLSRSAARKYDNSGKQIKGKVNPFITREDAIASGIKLGMVAAPFAKAGLSIKAQQRNNIRSRNEAIYRSRGKNILSDRSNSFVYADYSVK